MNDVGAGEIDTHAPGSSESPDTLVHTMARTVGATLGTIASGTAKLFGGLGVDEASSKRASRSKKPAKTEWSSVSAGQPSVQRLESRKKKRARHRQKLKRSRTKG
jgi:hypothetical protein